MSVVQESCDSDKLIKIFNDNFYRTSFNVADNCCYLLLCPLHQRIMLRKRFVFFPYVLLNPTKTWYESSLEGALMFLTGNANNDLVKRMKENIPFRRFICMHILRYQLPQSQRLITRLIYLAEVNPDYPNIVCCGNTNVHYDWFTIQDAINQNINRVWGPEVSFFSNAAISESNIDTNTIIEYSINDAFKYVPSDSPRTIEEFLLTSAHVTINDIERLYGDFIEHCYPSFFLTRYSFENYLVKHQIELSGKIIHRYYSAFRLRGKQYMHFHELLLGLAAIDYRTPNDNEYRMKLVFRYYDLNGDKHLNFNELQRLYQDITGNKNDNFEYQTKTLLKKIGIWNNQLEKSINYQQFKQAIEKGILKGTEKLCRNVSHPFGQIIRSLATEKLCKIVSNEKIHNIILNYRYTGRCMSCCKKKYFLSPDIIVLNKVGCYLKKIPLFPGAERSKKERIPAKLLNFMLNEIRKFNQKKPNKGLFADCNKTELKTFVDDFKQLVLEVCKLLEHEDRILKLGDPTYVIGDIHGNLEDLLQMEQCLWKSFPLLTANYLFLGDYVDRGKWGFECILYLIIMKYLLPDKIFLLRGNHEIRAIQKKYSFYKELARKYGAFNGYLLFELVNEIFDRLPFGAVINDSIFCSHGGIPYSLQNLKRLNDEMPKIIREPEIDALPVWELIWSDPLEYNKFSEIQELNVNDQVNSFFLPNTRRGTSYYFNEFALIIFFKENNLNYLIRAHEVPVSGFKFNFGTLCTTIFSSSHYCGADNECAVILVGRDSRIRIIRIDTTMNSPAT